jgi:hypothetical protein
MAAFDRELARESRGHIYARECAANAWHAKGVCYLLRAQFAAARDAFGEALARVPLHPGARAGLHILSRRESGTTTRPERMEIPADGTPLHFERQMAQAALFVDAGDLTTAVRIVADALAAAPGGSGWMIPIDPLLRVADYAAEYAPVLATLHIRAR